MNSMKKHIFCFLTVLFSSNLFGQVSKSLSSSEILQQLKKLSTIGSVLYIAAHPDDENTRLLAYLANEKKYKTAYLSITRGDGGQNLIGKEQGDLLGLIRTQELLAARKTDGAEQLFTRANDFGYSKNPEETFNFWNKESILKDVVLAIRKFKPDVIICRFPTTGEGGHGHHTASAIIALEAFDAAADPTIFPEQLAYTEVWKTKRIFWNTFNFGSTNTTAPNQLQIDVGGYNPLLGKSYGEIAAASRSCHKSQGFGSANQRGTNIEYFKLLKGDSVKSDLFEGISTNWGKFKGTEKIQKQIEVCIENFNTQNPKNSIMELVDIYKSIQGLDEKNAELKNWKIQKLKETESLLLACAGLWMECSVADYYAVPGQEILLNTQIICRNDANVILNKVSFLNQTDTLTNLPLKHNQFYSFKRKEKLKENLAYSNPYWLNNKHNTGMFIVEDVSLVGKPENESDTKVIFDISFPNLSLKVERALVYKSTDPVKGEVYRPFEILPPVTINLSENVFVFSNGIPKSISITIKANKSNIKGILIVKGSEGWNVQIKNTEINLQNKGDEQIIEAIVTPNKSSNFGKLESVFQIEGKGYTKGIKRIEYDHIPYQFVLIDAEAGLVNCDVKKTGTLIGYIPGAGDDVPLCLKQIGYDVVVISDELLMNDDLSKYQAIVTGVRAYNTNERLQVHYKKLMNYINSGGNLIVQYNTNNRIGPVKANIGPYPFTISRERVTDENAKVAFINPKHTVFNFPNIITEKDFEGWIQERGIYFATETDKAYESVLSMADFNESIGNGSLIIAKHGKGNFVYTGLSFFRELPAGVPGAYRLFANLLSLPKNK